VNVLSVGILKVASVCFVFFTVEAQTRLSTTGLDIKSKTYSFPSNSKVGKNRMYLSNEKSETKNRSLSKAHQRQSIQLSQCYSKAIKMSDLRNLS
jgi:hypothetical protein